MGLAVVAWLAVPWPAGCRDRERRASGTRRRCRQGAIETPSLPDLTRPAAGDDRHRAPPATAVESRRSRRLASRGWPVVACLAVPWPAGCRDRERVPAEPGAAAGRGDRDARFARSDPAGGWAMIVIGRPRERLSSFTDRGAWLHGVARGRVVGSALAGRLPGSRATASGTWRRCRQGAIETPSLPDLTGRLWR
jgi:hypothetical protein